MVDEQIEVRPLTPDRWNDFVELFESSPSTSGCWCMWPRVPSSTHRPSSDNRERMNQVVDAKQVPGLLAYIAGSTVGWIAIAQRREYRRIGDYGEPDAWVIACLYVRQGAHRAGVARRLVSAAVDYAHGQGATIIEAIPRGWRSGGEPGARRVSRLLVKAGFKEVEPIAEGVHFRMMS